jgi:hypothetical protein
MGSPDEPKADCALDILVEILHAEAHALADADASDPKPLALACRLEALKEFVNEYLKVEWKAGVA